LIKVTRLNGVEYLLNPHLFESIEGNPDTTITLVSGKKIVIRETPEQILDAIMKYRKKLGVFGNEE
jgi:flagellar protein FlbD